MGTKSYYANDKDQERLKKLISLSGPYTESYIIKMALRFCIFRIKDFLKFLPTAGDEE